MLPFTDSSFQARPSAPILILLHFFGSSHREWHHVVGTLQAKFRCVAADMPGFGDAANVQGYTVQRMAEQVCELVQHFAPAPVVLVGHSMGGKVTMVVASDPPANLTGIVLVAPSPLTPEPMHGKTRMVMARGNQSRKQAEIFVHGGAHRPLSAEDLQLGIEDVMRANDAAWKAWPQSGTREDWSMDITEITLPSLLVVGECDSSIPLAYQREHTLPILRNGQLEVIADAAHLLPFEAPDRLSDLIGDFANSM